MIDLYDEYKNRIFCCWKYLQRENRWLIIRLLDGPDLLDDDVGCGPLPPHQPRELLGNGGPSLRGGLTQGHLGNIHQLVPVITDLRRHKLNCGLFRVLKLILIEIFISFEPPLLEALWLFATDEA